MPQDPFAKYGGKAIQEEDPFAKYGGKAEPSTGTRPANPGSIEASPSYATQLYREGKAKLSDLVSGVKDRLVGAGIGVNNTALGASGLVNRATGGRLGVPPSVTLEELGLEPQNAGERQGMAAEQMAEFFVPAGRIGKAGKAVEAATAGLKGNRLLSAIRGGANIAAKSGMEAASAGGISKLHGEDPTAAAIGGAAGPVIGEVAGAAAPKMYKAALKASTTYDKATRAQMVRTGLEEGIPVSEKGGEKLKTLIDQLNSEVRGMLDPAVTINPSDIAKRAAPVADRYGKFAQVNPTDDLRAVQSSMDEFLGQHQTPAVPAVPGSSVTDPYTGVTSHTPGSPAIPAQDIPIPSDLVQDIKTGTYRNVKWKKGSPHQLAPASEAAQKALARGAKEELEVKFPGIKEKNAREGRAITLKEAIDRATNRIDNRDIVGIGAPSVAVATQAIGGPAALFGGLKLIPPSLTSRLAIELAKSKKRAIGPFGAALMSNATGREHPR